MKNIKTLFTEEDEPSSDTTPTHFGVKLNMVQHMSKQEKKLSVLPAQAKVCQDKILNVEQFEYS